MGKSGVVVHVATADRRVGQALLLPQMALVGGRKMDRRRSNACKVGTRTDRTQVAQKVENIESFPMPGLRTNASSAMPTPPPEVRDVNLGEIAQRDAPPRKPSIKRQRMHRLDVDDGRHVLLPDQRVDIRGEVLRQRAGRAANERDGSLI
ncbi:MAG: hypothetical protein JSR59_00915 [Proteobacteria bacterium]|nr:hypothetical protein [Pseudomonadota bacterium]